MCRKHAFTLVELLVVIAIVSLLAGLLLPVLEDALDSARTISCMNNLGQCNFAVQQYAGDGNGWAPGAFAQLYTGSTWVCLPPWFHTLGANGYMDWDPELTWAWNYAYKTGNLPETTQCPSFEPYSRQGCYAMQMHHWQTSSTLNNFVFTQIASPMRVASIRWGANGFEAYGVETAYFAGYTGKAQAPSGYPLLAHYMTWYPAYDAYGFRPWFRDSDSNGNVASLCHQQRGPTGFADGHVKNVGLGEAEENGLRHVKILYEYGESPQWPE